MDWSPANTVPGSEPRLHHPPCCRAPAPCLQRALPGSLQSHPTEPPVSSPALCPCHQLLPSAGCHRAGPQCHLGPPERRAIVPPLVSPSLLTCCSPKASCWGQQGGELCCLREKKTSAGGLGWVQPRSAPWQKSHWHGVGQALARSREERLACGTLRDQAKGWGALLGGRGGLFGGEKRPRSLPRQRQHGL